MYSPVVFLCNSSLSMLLSCWSLCDLMDCSIPGSCVLHCFSEFAQIHTQSHMNQWCYLTILSSAAPFSFCLQSLPASGPFPVSWLFTLGGQSIGTLASASVLPNNIQDWFPLGLIGLIFLHSKGLSQFKSRAQPSLWSNSHIPTWLLEKPELWLHGPLSAKWCLCFLICCLGLSRLSFQGANDFKFHGCSHCLQWCWSPRR